MLTGKQYDQLFREADRLESLCRGNELETGGAIRHAERFLAPDGDSGSFLVHNVDIISDLDIGWFMSHARDGALATLLVSERRTDRYLLFDSDMRLAGWTNVSTGEVPDHPAVPDYLNVNVNTVCLSSLPVSLRLPL